MKFHVDAWFKSESRMRLTMAQQGLYLNLLFAQWQRDGFLPNDPVLLWKIAGCDSQADFDAISAPVMERFQSDGNGKLFNQNCLDVFTEVRTQLTAQRESGRKGGISSAAKRAASNPSTTLEGALNDPATRREEKSKSKSEEEKNKTLLSKLKNSFDRCSSSQPEKPTPISFLREQFDYYLAQTKKNSNMYAFTNLRQEVAMRRLIELLPKVEYDLDRAQTHIRYAINRLAANDWSMGRDPKTNGKQYCDWDKHLFHSWEMFENWCNGSKG